MEKKNNSGIIIALCTVIIVLIAAVTYMFVSGTITINNQSNKENETEGKEEVKEENDNESNKQEEETDEEVELDLTDYSNIYDFVTKEGYTVRGTMIKDVFWSTDTLTNKSLDDSAKLAISLLINGTSQFKYDRAEQKIWGTASIYSLDGDVIVTQINELFGSDNGYKHITTSGIGPDFSKCTNLSYNSSTNKYEIYEGSGCGGGISLHASHNKIVKAVKNKDSIIVTEKIYFNNADGVFKDLKFTKKISDSYDENNSENYYAQGATVTYTFKLSKSGNYYFDNSKITY